MSDDGRMEMDRETAAHPVSWQAVRPINHAGFVVAQWVLCCRTQGLQVRFPHQSVMERQRWRGWLLVRGVFVSSTYAKKRDGRFSIGLSCRRSPVFRKHSSINTPLGVAEVRVGITTLLTKRWPYVRHDTQGFYSDMSHWCYTFHAVVIKRGRFISKRRNKRDSSGIDGQRFPSSVNLLEGRGGEKQSVWF